MQQNIYIALYLDLNSMAMCFLFCSYVGQNSSLSDSYAVKSCTSHLTGKIIVRQQI